MMVINYTPVISDGIIPAQAMDRPFPVSATPASPGMGVVMETVDKYMARFESMVLVPEGEGQCFIYGNQESLWRHTCCHWWNHRLSLWQLCDKESQKVGIIMCYCLEVPWWRHEMETFSALLAICAGNSPVTGEFPTKRPVTRRFNVFFDLILNKRLSKQSWSWSFETPLCSLWRHYNGVANDGLVPIGAKTLATIMRTYASHSKQKAIGESCLWSWEIQMLLLKLKHMDMDFHQCHCIAAIIHRHKSKENTNDKNAFCIRFVRMRLTHQSNASNIYCHGFTRIQHNRKRIWY